MGEIPRWAADLARLEFQGNYRVVAAKDMGDVYTRNLVRQFSVSNSAAGSPNGDQHEKKSTRPIAPGYVEISQGGPSSANTEVLRNETKPPGGSKETNSNANKWQGGRNDRQAKPPPSRANDSL